MLSLRAMSPKRMQGFSLIELMVALVIGLIVIGAVLALIMSIIRANNQTILATRLTQEMRATMAVIAGDVRRARGMEDPFRLTGPGLHLSALVHSDIARCLRYSYDDPSIEDPGQLIFHTVSLSDDGVVRLAVSDDVEPACGSGQELNSDFVTINDLTFTPQGIPAGGDVRRARRFVVTLNGQLADNPEIQRTLTQTVFTRSVAGN